MPITTGLWLKLILIGSTGSDVGVITASFSHEPAVILGHHYHFLAKTGIDIITCRFISLPYLAMN
jgi:hypothetical protein